MRIWSLDHLVIWSSFVNFAIERSNNNDQMTR